MPDTQKWAEVVKKLADQTENGQLNWSDSNLKRDDAEGPVCETVLFNRRLICYEYCYQSYETSGEPESTIGIAIEFVDFEGNPAWRLPETSAHAQLLDAIRYRKAGADAFLRDFLKSP